jgi:hypothetical protein
MDYSDDPRFKGYYFEDSFVLSVNIGLDQGVLDLEAVLSKDHPDFGPPNEGEQYPYKRVELWFKDAAFDYQPSGTKPSWDAEDRWDYGNIDSFKIEPPDIYCLEGEWGSLKARARSAFVKEVD